MTLYRQLLIWILVVFSAIITSVFAIQFNTTRDFLHEQQSTEIDNAVSAVSLALTPYLQVNDTASAKSMFNAIFKGNLYSKVHLGMLDNSDEVVLSYPTQVTNVPSCSSNYKSA